MPDFVSYTILKDSFIQERARRQVLRDQARRLQDDCDTTDQQLVAARAAQAVIRAVAMATQQQLERNISNIVTTALGAVFDNPEQFKISFVQRRGRTECDILFARGDQEYDPIGYTGGGVLDITCFALRVAFLCLRHNIRRVLWLDEPFRNLHGITEQERCSAMVKMISQRLGIQINMVSDVDAVNRNADRVFTCTLVNGITQIQTS